MRKTENIISSVVLLVLFNDTQAHENAAVYPPGQAGSLISAASAKRSCKMRSCAVAFVLLSLLHGATLAAAAVSMMFVFGESMVDAGNNNYLKNTTAQANHPPYGINFPGQVATGRWSDGYNIPDYLAMLMGIELPPCALCTNDTTYGANFGSAGSGILDTTQIGGQDLSFDDQIQLLEEFRARMDANVGDKNEALSIVNSAIFYINIGNNDVNVFTNATNEVLSDEVRDDLIQRFHDKIEDMIDYGGTKFIVTTNFAHGCAPGNPKPIKGTCLELNNRSAQKFNQGLAELMDFLRSEFENCTFVLADTFSIAVDVHDRPEVYGMNDVADACCPLVARDSQPWCSRGDAYCSNPEQSMFWDIFHPTDAFNRIAANFLWSSANYTSPITVQQLAAF